MKISVKLVLFFFVSISSLSAGQPKVLDTLYANEQMNLALFFPSEIRQGIVGSEDFAFTYNREKGQSLGLLKAVEGEPSNLLVITVDGKVYSYIVRYAEKLSELNRFISLAESIGNENGRMPSARIVEKNSVHDKVNVKDSLEIPTPEKESVSKDFLTKSCNSMLAGPERMRKIKRKKGMTLTVVNRVYYENLLFVQYEIANKSGIDFDIDSLEFSKVQGSNRKKSSYQQRPMQPIYTHGMPGKVRHGDTVKFVRVYRKATLGDGERFIVILRENLGSREVVLKKR